MNPLVPPRQRRRVPAPAVRVAWPGVWPPTRGDAASVDVTVLNSPILKLDALRVNRPTSMSNSMSCSWPRAYCLIHTL